MNLASEPHTGHIYLCLKSNKSNGVVNGRYYVYDSGTLCNFTKRDVLFLGYGDRILENAADFQLARRCPFCGVQTCDPFGGTMVIHDGIECAALWDARVKKYCPDCRTDTENGKCPKCDP